ncbi:MAG: SAM-dependent methyltransferase [Gammaproteobacteria bacterium]|nr:SAM-dependent methyltransferase [Gammaproteobacteria bacterium]
MASPSQALPAPDEDARAHGERVHAHIVAQIHDNGGWLDFARYMDLALYAPGLGYYSAGSTKFGAAGDFVTAPEAGTLFAHALARQLAPLLLAQESPVILEPGAGSGALAGELLPALNELGAPPARYLILEPSAQLQARQREYLKSRLTTRLLRRVKWLNRLPAQMPAGVLLANEVLDALPVQRFRITAEGVMPLGVSVTAKDELCWAQGPHDPAFAALVRARLGTLLDGLPPGYESEFCAMLPAWLTSVLECFEAGAALLIDYGLPRREIYLPERSAGTLRCHFRHRAHDDPLILPGLQDITAWVDFTTVADTAGQCGWEVAGYATQAHFLLDGGIDIATVAAQSLSPESVTRASELKTLLMPGEMGERFRVMALTRGLNMQPPGFGLRDLRDRL